MRFLSVLLSISLVVAGCNGNGQHTTPSAPEDPALASGGEVANPSDDDANDEDLAPLEAVEAPRIESNTSPTARTYHVTLGTPAPTTGLLLNEEAAAYVLAELEAFESRVALALSTQRDMDMARMRLEVGRLRLEMNADRERFRLTIEARDGEIARLMEMNERIVHNSQEFPWETVLIGVGGVVLGLLVGFVGGFVAAN